MWLLALWSVASAAPNEDVYWAYQHVGCELLEEVEACKQVAGRDAKIDRTAACRSVAQLMVERRDAGHVFTTNGSHGPSIIDAFKFMDTMCADQPEALAGVWPLVAPDNEWSVVGFAEASKRMGSEHQQGCAAWSLAAQGFPKPRIEWELRLRAVADCGDVAGVEQALGSKVRKPLGQALVGWATLQAGDRMQGCALLRQAAARDPDVPVGRIADTPAYLVRTSCSD